MRLLRSTIGTSNHLSVQNCYISDVANPMSEKFLHGRTLLRTCVRHCPLRPPRTLFLFFAQTQVEQECLKHQACKSIEISEIRRYQASSFLFICYLNISRYFRTIFMFVFELGKEKCENSRSFVGSLRAGICLHSLNTHDIFGSKILLLL